ncbi:heavy-metal-associated domain-containing protein [Paracoccus aeridis]|uniref:heavy-metal-associated domain-containing protein n=1 Tax=Paracoccus aeridis TaxID=1966466 RepID=UPI0010AA1728|nr:heavy-metal-associated domain-containing protein [Paracoccus aeridis]
MRFQVSDMACADCARAIERAVAQAGGKAAADPQSRLVTVENLGTQPAIAAISAAGYTAEPLD